MHKVSYFLSVQVDNILRSWHQSSVMSNPMPMMALRNSFAVERNKVDKQDSTFSPGHAHGFGWRENFVSYS